MKYARSDCGLRKSKPKCRVGQHRLAIGLARAELKNHGKARLFEYAIRYLQTAAGTLFVEIRSGAETFRTIRPSQEERAVQRLIYFGTLFEDVTIADHANVRGMAPRHFLIAVPTLIAIQRFELLNQRPA